MDVNWVIELLQRHGLLCKSETETCNLSILEGHCNCGEVYKELRGE